jgi:pyruvate dehydrogenase E2 component (dihydrolipoamide acetyltransferase)
MPDFKLPDLGEGVTEAEVDRWLVKEGDVIAEDDPLVEVITDKATAEIPSPFEGVVARIHVQAGDVVPVGTVLVSIEAEAGATGGNGEPQAVSDVASVATDAITAVGERVGDASDGGGVKAMPPVRKLARELGVDLTAVSGSGPGGRITRADVEGAAGGSAAPAAATSDAPASGGRREPLRGVRRVIAERMAEAHRVVPQVTHVEECDVTELDATRKLANERSPNELRLTFMPFIVKAVTTSLKEFPALNASLDEDPGEIVFHDRYDIGVAVDTPAGLMVPVVKGADKKRLRDLAKEIDRLATAAREGHLIAHELRGSTFTVTSPGPFGGLMATPIVFHPQSAILGVHRATDRPVVRDGQIVIRKMMNLSITFDHRILDGMTAAKFVLNVVRLLEHPAVLALES